MCSILRGGLGGGGLGVSVVNRGFHRGSVARRRARNRRDRSGGDEIPDDARLAAEPTPQRGRLRIEIEKAKRREKKRIGAFRTLLSLVWDLLRVAYRASKRRLGVEEGDGDGLTCFGRGRSRRGPSWLWEWGQTQRGEKYLSACVDLRGRTVTKRFGLEWHYLW